MPVSTETSEYTQTLSKTIEQIGLEPDEERQCVYLPGQRAREVAFRYPREIPGLYHSLMDLNFRRTGLIVYRPACRGCNECHAIRIPVREFRPNRNQRRCWKRNHDIQVEVAPPSLRDRHQGQMDESWGAFCRFLYESPLHSLEMVYRLKDRLLGAGIVDVEPQAGSTVYFYFDPTETSRSLGTFNILWTLEWCHRQNIDHLYLGYYVADSRQMSYKANFRPCEILQPSGQWQKLTR